MVMRGLNKKVLRPPLELRSCYRSYSLILLRALFVLLPFKLSVFQSARLVIYAANTPETFLITVSEKHELANLYSETVFPDIAKNEC